MVEFGAIIDGDGDTMGFVSDRGYWYGWVIGVDDDGDSMDSQQFIAMIYGDDDSDNDELDLDGDGDSLGFVADRGYWFGWVMGVDDDGDSMESRQFLAMIFGDDDRDDGELDLDTDRGLMT